MGPEHAPLAPEGICRRDLYAHATACVDLVRPQFSTMAVAGRGRRAPRRIGLGNRAHGAARSLNSKAILGHSGAGCARFFYLGCGLFRQPRYLARANLLSAPRWAGRVGWLMLELPRPEAMLVFGHIDALAAESDAFHFETHTLFVAGIVSEFDFAA